MDNKKYNLSPEIIEIIMVLDDNYFDVDFITEVINMVFGKPNKEKEFLNYLKKENNTSEVLLTKDMIINNIDKLLKN